MHDIFIGLHVPKCAGTSVLETVLDKLPAHEVYQNTSLFRNWKEGRPEFLELRRPELLRFLWGHHIHEEMVRFYKDPFLFTGLRDPLERLKSEYKFQKRLAEKLGLAVPDPASFQSVRDPLCKFLVSRFPMTAGVQGSPFDRARNVLSVFHHVYFSENFEVSTMPILRAVGVNAAPKECNKSRSDEVSIDIDEENLVNDYELYNWAKGHFGGELDFARSAQKSRIERLLYSKDGEKMKPDVTKLSEFLARVEAGEMRDFSLVDRDISSLENIRNAIDVRLKHLYSVRGLSKS